VEPAGADLGVWAGLAGGLTELVIAPAVDGSGQRQGASMIAAGADLDVRAGLIAYLE
jgi:hypothetical protein